MKKQTIIGLMYAAAGTAAVIAAHFLKMFLFHRGEIGESSAVVIMTIMILGASNAAYKAALEQAKSDASKAQKS